MKRLNAILTLFLCLALIPATVHALTPPSDPVPPPDSAHPTLGDALTPVDAVVLVSIGDALTKADDTVISLEDKVVTGRFSESGSYFFYIEEDDRSAGIRVNSSLAVAPEDRVDISSGTLSSISGERCLNNVSAETAPSGDPVPTPLAMDNPTVGGATLDPATGYTPGITGAIGAYNKGLLIMTWGKVTHVNSSSGYFYIDDGTGISDGTGFGGIRIRASGVTWPVVNQFVVVTGVSSSFIPQTSIRRQIRVRGDSDIVLTSGETISCPANTLRPAVPPSTVWWSLVGLPGVPINSNPTSVFANTTQYMPGSTLVDNLTRWEPTGDQDTYPYVTYPSSGVYKNGSIVAVPFGCIYSGQGYWIRNDDTEGVDAEGAISYLGVMEPVQSTDRYISLPRKRLTCIGNPFDHTVLYQSVLVTDGNCILPLMEAYEKGWVSPCGYWWDNASQGLNPLEAELQWADPTQICMRPWQGYWVVSERDNVALIILHGGEESISLTADPPVITSGGSTEITADLTLRSGAPMINAPVDFVTTAGTLSATTPSEGWTDDNGEIKVTLSSVPTGQLAIVTASTDYSCDGPITKEVRIGESGTVAYVELTADPASIPADGVYQSTIAVHVTNSGGVGLSSKTVDFVKDGGGTLSATSLLTDGSGNGTVTLTSSTTPETVTVTATCEGVSGQVSVEFAAVTLPPAPTVVDDGETTSSAHVLHATWSTTEPMENIASFLYAIGTTSGGTDISDWQVVSSIDPKATEVTRTDLDLTPGTTYYFAVRILSVSGIHGQIGVSDGIQVIFQAVSNVEQTLLQPAGSYVEIPAVPLQPVVTTHCNQTVRDFTGDIFYVEDRDRSKGIRVQYAGDPPVSRGDYVSLQGEVRIDDDCKEAYLAASSVSVISSGNPVPSPLSTLTRNWGGTTFGNKPGVTVPTIPSLYNKGFLLRCSGGAVKAVYALEEDPCFYLDDGCALNDTTHGSTTGVRISWKWQAVSNENPAIVPPPVNSYVEVTGIMSSWCIGNCTPDNPNPQIIRVLRVRDQADIRVISDVTDPTISITEPSGDEVHVAQDNPYVLISGLASDEGADQTGIAYVQVKIDSEPTWHVADYDDGTWTYDGWQVTQAGPHTIEARTSDLGGHIVSTTKNVTVIWVSVKYVKWNSPSPTDGGSWEHAYHTVQAGLDGASSGDDVWVAAGMYNEHITLTTGRRLYGGFAGDETSREQRNILGNPTILDGGASETVVTCPSGLTSSTVIDGFTIQNGRGYYSGGVYCSSSSPTITNNTIAGNRGAGIYCYNSSPTLSSNTVEGNYTGIDCFDSSPMVSSNRLDNNGTGICCYGFSSSPTIVNNAIRDSEGGGVYCDYGSSPTVTNNTIAGNTNPYGGGGVYCEWGSSPSISNNIIAFNDSGIYSSGNPTLRNNCVYGNTAYDYDGVSLGTGDISVDPKLANLAQGNLHIQPNSPCVDAGWNQAPGIPGTDMDGQPRILDGTVDIGADESGGCEWYYLTLVSDPPYPPQGGTVTITANVKDRNGQNVEAITVHFSVSDGTITEINGQPLPEGMTIACGQTDSSGNVTAVVTRATAGQVTVTAEVSNSCETDDTTERTDVRFCDADCPGDWPMFMHDPQHTGLSHYCDTEVSEGFNGGSPNWTVSLPTSQANMFYLPLYDSSPVVSNGILVVGAWSTEQVGDVLAFRADANGGSEPVQLWSASAHPTYPPDPAMGGVSSTACIYDNKVYIGSANGYLYCLNLETGAQIWSRPVFDQAATPDARRKVYSSPVVHEGIVYISNYAAMLYAFNAATGNTVSGWPVLLGSSRSYGTSSPAIATAGSNDYVLVGCDDHYIYKVNADRRIWERLALGSIVESSPSVSGDYGYVGCSRLGASNLYKLLIEPFQVSDEETLHHEVRTTPALAFDYLYTGDDTGNELYQVAADTLNMLYSFPADPYDYFVSSAGLTNTGQSAAGIAYVGNDNGRLYALDALDVRTLRASYDTGGLIRSSPTVVYMLDGSNNLNRWVFVTSRANGLYAFKTQIN